MLVTSEHLRTGKEYDAAVIWIEDITKDSFKVCLRELQNFDGKHEDIYVVCEQFIYFQNPLMLVIKCNLKRLGKLWSFLVSWPS